MPHSTPGMTLWDAADHLASDKADDHYLEAALEDGDKALLDAVLDDINRARARRSSIRPTR